MLSDFVVLFDNFRCRANARMFNLIKGWLNPILGCFVLVCRDELQICSGRNELAKRKHGNTLCVRQRRIQSEETHITFPAVLLDVGFGRVFFFSLFRFGFGLHMLVSAAFSFSIFELGFGFHISF